MIKVVKVPIMRKRRSLVEGPRGVQDTTLPVSAQSLRTRVTNRFKRTFPSVLRCDLATRIELFLHGIDWMMDTWGESWDSAWPSGICYPRQMTLVTTPKLADNDQS